MNKSETRKRISEIRKELKQSDLQLILGVNSFCLVNPKGTKVNYIKFDTEALPFCCGAVELGNLSIGGNIFRNNYILLLIEATLLFKKISCISKNTKDLLHGKGLILCSNGKGAWKYVEKVLENNLSKEFIHCSTTKNTSGNIVKVYVAKF